MKLLFDQNLSYKLVVALEEQYPGSQHVRQAKLDTADDEKVWNYAKKEGLAIVSRDSDFYHRSVFLGQPPKVVWLRIGNCSTEQIQQFLEANQTEMLSFNNDSGVSFLILR